MGRMLIVRSFTWKPVKMRRQLLIFALTLGLAASASLPEISTYAKVTKNGEQTNVTDHGGPLSWFIKTFSPANTTKEEVAEGRSSQDISITVSPVYVPPRIPDLQKGEAVDYPTTKRYSTLDEDMIARLDAQSQARKQAQDRFHPPAIFEHDIAHGNAAKLKGTSAPSSSRPTGPPQDSGPGPGPSGPGYSSPVFPGSYDYNPPSFINAKPISMDSYSPPDSMSKAPTAVDTQPVSYGEDAYSPPGDYPDPDHGSDYGSKPAYSPPKAIEYSGHYDHPTFVDDPYIHDHDHDHHHHHDHDYHDIIYDHLPPDHTTPAPEMMDQRLNKRPYSYYFIGKKLWYVPLYFSIYFIVYIAALILKSISRHKINFPSALAAAAAQSSRSSKSSDGPGWMDLTVRVIEGIEAAKKAFEKKP